MASSADNALIVQSDGSVLLEVHAPRAEAACEALAPFAELVKSPEHVHTYRLTPLSIWNARSTGLSRGAMVAAPCEHAKYPVPDNVVTEVGELAARYGRVVLTRDGDAGDTLVLTWRPDRESGFPHLSPFAARSWGLIIYDEVHLLPAPVFRVTAELQARHRLGLTATLVREDGRQGDVFALIGPKRYDVPWRDLERRAWIATAVCTEVRVPMSQERRMEYAIAERRAQFRIAAENPEKTSQVLSILGRCREGRVLVIGEYLTQIDALARDLAAPLVTGKTPQTEREELYDRCRRGEVRLLVLSKVGSFAIDLPDADVLIQASGMFGSRQEEALRLGRILRPKADGRTARFFSLVSRDTREEELAHHRQLFLTEQEYSYRSEIAQGASAR